MSDPSFMERFGPRLVANGYPILPIMPGTKKPGRWRGGAWSDYPDWTRHAERSTTEHELEVWRGWPDAGVGVVCGQVVAVDIDITDPELALEIERLARERLGDTAALRIGRAPKRLLVYRAAEPFPGIRRAPLEVLGWASSSSRMRSIRTPASPMHGPRRAWLISTSAVFRRSMTPPCGHSSTRRWPSCRII